MSEMTYHRWKQIERLQWDKALKDNPTANRRRLEKNLRTAMILTHGPCPPEPGPGILEDKMDGKKSNIPKWLLALGFGVLSVAGPGGIIYLATADGSLSWAEGIAIGNAILWAAAGKFSNPEKKLSPLPSVK